MPCLDILMAQAVHVAQAFNFVLAVIRILQEIGLMRRVSKPGPGCAQAASGTVRCCGVVMDTLRSLSPLVYDRLSEIRSPRSAQAD